MTDEKVQQTTELLRDNKKLLDELFEEAQKENDELAEIKEELDNLGKSHAAAEIRKNQLINAIKTKTGNAQIVKREIAQYEKELEDDAYARKVNSLIEKQKTFWEVLPSRLQHHIDELGGDLEGFGSNTDPQKATSIFRKIHESNEISDRALAIRSAVGNYNQCIEDLCVAHVDGNDVPITKKQQRISVLDNFIMKREVAGIWNT